MFIRKLILSQKIRKVASALPGTTPPENYMIIHLYNFAVFIPLYTDTQIKGIESWSYYWNSDPSSQRLSRILAFIRNYKCEDWIIHWHWCRDLSVKDNIITLVGYRKKMREFGLA